MILKEFRQHFFLLSFKAKYIEIELLALCQSEFWHDLRCVNERLWSRRLHVAIQPPICS